MKKLFYLLTILGLGFTACEPLEDINKEIDALGEIISGDAIFALTDDDYDALDKGFGNFNSTDEAKDLISGLLMDKYPVWGVGSSALVTYKLYAPRKDEKNLIIYEVTTEDYDANPDTAQYDNFDDMDQIYAFLDTKYPAPTDRDLVSLTYKFYNGGLKTLNNGFLYLNDAWELIEGFTSDEYAAMGEGFPNFSNEDEALAKIPVFLKDKFKYDTKVAGDVHAAMYKLYIGGGVTESYVVYFIYDGSDWSKYNNVIEETLQFGHDGTNWVPDNTIKYTLVAADYALVGNDRYGNFDVRSGKDDEPEAARLAKFNTILLNNFPNSEEGQKFLVSYNIYNGSDGVWTMSVVFDGEAYVLN